MSKEILLVSEDQISDRRNIESLEKGLNLYERLRDAGRVGVDLNQLDKILSASEIFNDLDRVIENICAADVIDTRLTSLTLKSVAGLMLSKASGLADETWGGVRRVSLHPSNDPTARRGARILSMVHELHKAGYQGLRIIGSRPVGADHWRCYITPAFNVQNDGWTPVDWFERVVTCTTENSEFFGWHDAVGASARQLAEKFKERFPEICHFSAIRDWSYAGWLSEVLNRAELGDLPIFMDDYYLYLSRSPNVPPPQIEKSIEKSLTPKLIATKDLNGSLVPFSNEALCRLEMFALTYDGYANGTSVEELAQRKQAVLGDLSRSSIDQLRESLFFVQRCMKWNDQGYMPPELPKELRLLTHEIRARYLPQ